MQPDLGTEHPPSPRAFYSTAGLQGQVLINYIPVLRGDITNDINALLPGSSTAAPWLISAIDAHLQIVPDLLQRLEPDLSRRHLSSALLPTMYQYSIWYELRSRNASSTSAPHPSARLHAFRDSAGRQVQDFLGGYMKAHNALPTMQTKQAELLRTRLLGKHIADQPDWGGWLLLASVAAIRSSDTLPRPGRRRRRLPWNRKRGSDAGIALEIGETLIMSTALGLLDLA